MRAFSFTSRDGERMSNSCPVPPSESRPHVQLTGAALIDGERRNHRRAAVSACLVLTALRYVYIIISWFFHRDSLADFVDPPLLFQVKEIHLKGVE